ncbi:MAG: polysaccharide biosynthesis protein [Bacillota bacterium]|nr:polysaccharide biosynthesis protein [Bacillota bacterium]
MFKGKKILVIGGTGSIGSALVKDILTQKPETLRIFGRDEYKQSIMQQELSEHQNVRFLLGDIRDKERVDRAMNEIDIVFNLAALKHVPACEYDPFEAIKTNVMGTQNVIECAMAKNVQKVIYTSSDKAVSPTNTMGATKLLAERLMSSANYAKGKSKTVFASVRFGNVLGSRGSVIPLWQKQIRENRYVTITEPDMTRFMMNIQQAVSLVNKACCISTGGEVFVLKMPVIKLIDLAEVVIENECENLGISPKQVEIKKIGLRPGEKLFEELMTCQESFGAFENDDLFVIVPHQNEDAAEYNDLKHAKLGEYSSKNESGIKKSEIWELLRQAQIL